MLKCTCVWRRRWRLPHLPASAVFRGTVLYGIEVFAWTTGLQARRRMQLQGPNILLTTHGGSDLGTSWPNLRWLRA